MSDRSDEELVGDVDITDFDLHDTSGSKSHGAKSDGKKEQEQLPAKKHQPAKTEGHKNNTSKKESPAVSVKQTLKRKGPAKPSVDNDLLQAFAIGGLVSGKTVGQAGGKKRKTEPVKKTVSGSQLSVEKETTSKVNVKSGDVRIKEIGIEGNEIKTLSTGVDEDSNVTVTKGKIEKRENKPENELKATTTSQSEVKKEGVKEEVKTKLGSNDKQNTASSIKSDIKKESPKKEIKKETEEIKNGIETKMELDADIEQIIADALSKESDITFIEESVKSKKPYFNSPLTKGSSQSSTLKKVEENSPGSLKKKIEEPKKSTSLKETPKEKSSLTDISSKTPISKKNNETETQNENDKKETTPSVNILKNDSTGPSKIEMRKDTQKAEYRFTEEDYKNIDLYLADQMFDRIRQKAISSKQAMRYNVKISPLEMSDLAQPTFQQIIQLHPSTTLFFKHQAVKFRKKKGFAEATFYTMTELKEFVYQLTQLKLCEKKVDVLITAQRPAQKPDTLSFVLHLNRNGKLLKLIDSGEDPMITKPIPVGLNTPRIQFERVPSTSNGAFMHSMFPFTNNVLITRSQVGKETSPMYHGPLFVYYVNQRWLEAVTECCTDFTANNYPLVLVEESSSGKSASAKTPSENKTEKKTAPSSAGQEPSDDGDYDDDDDPVSNMTRDVCADMLESIQKLKELESDNPNMKRILEMQAQLNNLQKSLKKPGNKFKPDDDANRGSGSELTPGERRQKDKLSLEEMFEETTRAELQREEQAKKQREEELQKRKELELKRKSQWAKKVLSDYKQQGVKGEMSEEAQKMLKQREQRIKERGEEAKRKEEQEQIRLQQEKEEEERKELERKRLIKKIEEARLKDSQKADKLSTSQLLWKAPSHEASSSNRYGPNSTSGGKRYREMDQQRSRPREGGKGSSLLIDDGVDDRLANFERELAQQGKIDGRNVPSPPDRSDDHFVSEDEGADYTVVQEKNYHDLWVQNQLHILPVNYRVRMSSMVNRLCPVQSCPAKAPFRDEEAYQEHWSIFHEPHTTMRFCQRCSAYFVNCEELEKHMMKHHHLSSHEAERLARSSRLKVVSNPSFRDPLPFLPPLLSS